MQASFLRDRAMKHLDALRLLGSQLYRLTNGFEQALPVA